MYGYLHLKQFCMIVQNEKRYAKYCKMTKNIINYKSWYHAIQKCFSPTSDALNNEFKKKYSVEDYFNSVLKNKL